MRNTSFDFTGSAFVVTGASSGMGREVARQLAADGATVLAIARTKTVLDAFAAEQDGIVPFACDVCDKERLQAGIEQFVQEHGKLCGAVHAAGISAMTPLRRFNEEAARRVMDVSFWAGVNLMQIVNKKKLSMPQCTSVLFSSTSAYAAEKSLFAYASAKAAMQTAVRVMAKEIGMSGRRINTISPGWVQTPMTQKDIEAQTVDDSVLERHLLGLGTPEKVAGMVLFLLSAEADWLTGADFVVDGGYLLGEA